MERKKGKLIKLIILILLIILSICIFIVFYKKNKHTDIMERKVTSYLDYGNASTVSDNGYVIVGSNNQNNSSLEKASISFYDSNQKVLERVYNKGYNSTYFDVINDGDGMVCVGSFESTKKELQDGSRTALIVKYDTKGDVVFENDFQIISNSRYNSIIKVDDGYIVCGQSINNNSDLGNSGAVLIKYDKDGKEVWRRYTGNTNAKYNDLIYLNGIIYAVGVDNNIGILSQFDINGNLINNTYYEGMDEDGFSSIKESNGILYLCGGKLVEDNTYGVVVTYLLDGKYYNEIVYTDNHNVRFNKLIVDSNNDIVIIGNKNTYENDKYISSGIIGKYTWDLKEMSVIKHISNKEVVFTDLFEYQNEYAIVGNYKTNEEMVNQKVFLYSTSLKNLGA